MLVPYTELSFTSLFPSVWSSPMQLKTDETCETLWLKLLKSATIIQNYQNYMIMSSETIV